MWPSEITILVVVSWTKIQNKTISYQHNTEMKTKITLKILKEYQN